jgi:hypothetical protein
MWKEMLSISIERSGIDKRVAFRQDQAGSSFKRSPEKPESIDYFKRNN